MAARREMAARQETDQGSGRPDGAGFRPGAGTPSGAPLAAPPPGDRAGEWRAGGAHLRPALQASDRSGAASASHPGGIAWWLWVLLLGSLVFLAVARNYVHHAKARLSGPMETIPFLDALGPAEPARAGALDLTWGEVPGATSYRLSVSSITGRIVVDSLPVDGTEWIPPDEVLPALVRGEYRWKVEAQDEKGRVLARSGEGVFRVR